MPGQGHRDHRPNRPGSHRRQIAQAHRQGLVPDAARLDGLQVEIDAIHQHIDRHHALSLFR